MSHLLFTLITICVGLNFSVITSVNAQITTRVLTIPANTTDELAIYDSEDSPDEGVRFITVGLHSQKYNLTLFKSNETNNASVNGHNIGLVLFPSEDNGYIFIVNPNPHDVNALLTTSQHGDNDPVPGGCNQEFPLEISPFLRLYDNSYVNRLDYQYANIGSPNGFPQSNCDKSQLVIKYDIYSYFLKENDFTEEEYFRSIILMSNLTDITESGSLLTNITKNRSYFYSYPGRGIVYTIVASSENYRSAYVPIVTYDCKDLNNCVNHNAYDIALVIVYGLVGFLVVFRGHYWFQTRMLKNDLDNNLKNTILTIEMVFFGAIDGSLIAYILITKFFEMSESQTTIYTSAIGILISVLWLFVWKIVNIPALSLILSGLSLGFLLCATVLFTNIGNLELFHNDVNYWLILCCTSILLTLFFLMVNAVVLSVVSTSIVGSYLAVVAVDRFIDGSLSFIILNVVKRAHFHYTAFNTVPFQNKDIVLSILWVLLSLTGIVMQMYHSKDSSRSPFPAPTSCSHPHRERRRSRLSLDGIERGRNNNLRRSRRPRNGRWSPVAPEQTDSASNRPVADERSALLFHNYNINTRPNDTRARLNRRDSPPPDYDHIPDANHRHYISI